jgi:hypothetical protein
VSQSKEKIMRISLLAAVLSLVAFAPPPAVAGDCAPCAAQGYAAPVQQFVAPVYAPVQVQRIEVQQYAAPVQFQKIQVQRQEFRQAVQVQRIEVQQYAAPSSVRFQSSEFRSSSRGRREIRVEKSESRSGLFGQRTTRTERLIVR